MTTPDPREEFTVRFPNPAANEPGQPTEIQVRGTVDHVTKTITYELPDHTRTTLDIITARALQMILWQGVFGSLQPTGPKLQVERSIGNDRPWLYRPTTRFERPR